MATEHDYPRFSDAEFARRHAAMRARMAQAELEALVVYGRGRGWEPLLVGPDLTYVCLPEVQLQGRVTDDEGQPIAGINVYAYVTNMGPPAVPTDAVPDSG